MKRLALLVIVAMAACSSSDYDDGPMEGPRRGGYGGGYGGDRPMMGRGGAGVLEMMPPDDWWHDDRIAGAVNLSSDQVTKLDQIAKDHGDDVSRLTRDSEVAVRDLRSTLDADAPAANDIVTAAQRVRTLRNEIFDRQVQLLAAERTVLTKQQWQSLQDAMRERPRGDRGGFRPRGGMGGRGRGRGPGWPG